MLVGIFDTVFDRPSLEARVDAVRARGAQAIQLHLTSVGLSALPLEIDPSLPSRIRAACGARGVEVAAITGTFNMAHPDAKVRADGVRRLSALCKAAPGMGTNVIAVCTGTRNTESMWRPHPENASDEAWRDLTETMAAVLKVAEARGAVLAMEPEVNNVVSSPKLARKLIDEMQSPALKVCLDPANVFAEGELPRMPEVLDEMFDLLGPYVVYAHAKDLDHDGDAGHLAAGQGVLDYERYIEGLRTIGYRGAVVLHGLTEQQAPGCIAFLKRHLDTGTPLR